MDSSSSSTGGQTPAALLELPSGTPAAAVLEPIAGWVQQLPPDKRLYVLMQELTFSVEALDRLGEVYDALAHINPRVLCVPLLPAAGWTHGKVASLVDLQHIIATDQAWHGQRQQQQEGHTQTTTLLRQLSACRPAGLRALHSLQPAQLSRGAVQSGTATAAVAAAGHAHESGGAAAGQAQVDASQGAVAAHQAEAETSRAAAVDPRPASTLAPLRFSRVALGGTFDRLHSGHELLLAAAALVSTQYVFVGVTADALLAKKAHRELLEPYDVRQRAALSFMAAVNPAVQLQAGPLSDPKAPTMAELDPDMEAIVVSSETVPGAKAINEGRVRRGFRPLTVVVVPVIGLQQHSGHKLSSTDLRARDAAQQQQQQCT